MKKKWSIVLGIVVLVLVGLALSLFLFKEALFNQFAASTLFISGKPLKFGNYTVSVQKVEGNRLFGVEVSDNEKKLKAESGEYAYSPKDDTLKINLSGGVAEYTDPKNPKMSYQLTFKKYSIKIKLDTIKSKLNKK